MYFSNIFSLKIVSERQLGVKRLSLEPVFNKYQGKYTFFIKNNSQKYICIYKIYQ